MNRHQKLTKAYLLKFISVSKLIRNLQKDILAAPGIIDYYINQPRVLILDDLGEEKPTEYVDSAIDSLLCERSHANKQTIITSNYSPAELSSRFGSDRALSRINFKGNTVDFTDSKPYR